MSFYFAPQQELSGSAWLSLEPEIITGTKKKKKRTGFSFPDKPLTVTWYNLFEYHAATTVMFCYISCPGV